MGSAIQITIVRGRPGLRSSMSFLLGDYGRFHRSEVNRILEQNTLTFIEGPDVEGAMEIDASLLKTALQEKGGEIDAIEDDELRVPFQRLRDYYLSLPETESAFALADIVLGS